ncbi:MAG: hypothetical protein US40_C0009G0006 [Candidatus Roizmanbacteria bacterium GW2011_GWC2_37_13]|uniref:Uncharacterized protein n=1 Tax=Candidatus Roizmanbacteria bacterium GW2011_GWC2_37_13 TaxID=1618486 RepID=A0A0G0GGV1_9BACT|nr:MAG: hypothetical protein US38_C0009G0009 [Candidatus Roizmanbacteria bacterium GW2011_GWC1_37_12]KKQ25300.1 MAG: hypothetical protein US40_C0009G0006 [Candidatus Roizmanbacteria bacterium GW2011_GWC2_37_13]
MDLVYARRNRLSEIFADIGQVTLASVFFHFIVDKYDVERAMIGLILSIVCWTFSLLLVKIKI